MKTALELAGKLSVMGTQLVDEKGKAFQMRGISTHGIGWYPQYITKETFKTFRDEWGANVIRLAMYTAEECGYCTQNDEARLFQKALVKKGVDICEELGMYVIVDWHILSDNNPNMYIDLALDFFSEISDYCKDKKNVLYEICNEPNGAVTWQDVKDYAEKILPVIKKNVPDAVIIIGTPTWSQDVDLAAADPVTGYDNLMYTLHFYADTHRDALREKMLTAKQAGLPIMVTEFGICDASGNGANNLEEGQKWIDVLNQEKISYCIWNLSNKNESSALLRSDCEKNAAWKQEDLSQAAMWYQKILKL